MKVHYRTVGNKALCQLPVRGTAVLTTTPNIGKVTCNPCVAMYNSDDVQAAMRGEQPTTIATHTQDLRELDTTSAKADLRRRQVVPAT